MEAASIAHAAPRRARAPRPARGQPLARASSPQLLGMLLFIISEIMVFGAFFTAYFFIRVVDGDRRGSRSTATSSRVAVAGVNTAILVSSSVTLHWARDVDQERQPLRPEGRACSRRSCSA